MMQLNLVNNKRGWKKAYKQAEGKHPNGYLDSATWKCHATRYDWDLPMGGMNEIGLMAAVLALPAAH